MSRQQEIIPLEPPLGGIRKDLDFQRKSPYFAERMLNTRAFDTISGRGRIGSRPGTVKAYSKWLADSDGGGVAGSGPTTIVADKDTYLYEGGASTNYNGQGLLLTGDFGSTTSRPILHFDLTGIPVGAIVTSARLELKITDNQLVANATALILRLTNDSWNEAQATWRQSVTGTDWTTIGGDYDTFNQASMGLLPDEDGYAISYNMKGLCQETVDSPVYDGSLNVLMFMAGSSTNIITFADSEHATSAYRPTLYVEWLTGTSGDSPEIRMLTECRTLDGTQETTFVEPFDDDPMSATNWIHRSWTIDGTASAGLPSIAGPGGGEGFATASSNQVRSAHLHSQDDAAVTSPREVSVIPVNLPIGARITLLMDMDDTSPSPSAGIRLRAGIPLTAGLWSLSLYYNDAPIASVDASSPDTFIGRKTLRLRMDGNGRIEVFWTDQINPSISVTIDGYNNTDNTTGFALYGPTGTIGCTIDSFAYTYTVASQDKPRTMLVGSSNGYIDRETVDGQMIRVSTTLSLQNNSLISAANRLEKLYIADYELRIEGTGGANTGTSFDDSSVSDWTAHSISTLDDRIEIISGTGFTLDSDGIPIGPGVYGISSVVSGNIVLSSQPGGVNATSISYRIVRGPKIYDSANDVTPVSLIGLGTVGVSQFPVGCRHFSLWADRIVAVNDPIRPHQWFMSAQGYPLLWDYGNSGTVGENGLTTDSILLSLGTASAVSQDVSEVEGTLGDPIICTIPLTNDYLVFACKNSFHVLRGNPLLNGAFNAISRTVGILDIGAYCLTPENRLYVMTPDGLYELNLQGAVPVSRDLIPQELIGINPDQHEVTLAYDHLNRGVLISAVPRAIIRHTTLQSYCYFFDQRTGGFFPDKYPEDHDATAMVSHTSDLDSVPRVMRGGRDGFIRKYENNVATDDGTNFDSNCLYGPLRLGDGEYGEGYLQQIICVMDTISGPVTVRAFTGHTAQAALANVPRYETTMNGGRNRNRWPRLRGGACYIDVVGTPGTRWAQESLTVTRQKAGRLLTT